jgi:hypothetical protein
MILLNGRGQIGEGLAKIITKQYSVEVYHTWNFVNKTNKAQEIELEKYRHFLKKIHNPKNKVAFISTSSIDNNSYVIKKRYGETLTRQLDSYIIIRLPNIIGKGVLDRLISIEDYYPGTIQYTNIAAACKFIYRSCISETNTTLSCPYDSMSVDNIKSIINYVKKSINES